MTVGFISYFAAFLAYTIFSILLLTAWRGRLTGAFALAATGSSVLWTGIALLWIDSDHAHSIWQWLNSIVEWFRNSTWLLFLTYILVIERDNSIRRTWFAFIIIVLFSTAFLTIVLPIWLDASGELWYSLLLKSQLFGAIGIAVVGLLLIEQLYRNRRFSNRWSIKHLCLGLGAIFAYDLFFYSEALLLQHINLRLWEARGLVNALVVPLIAVSTARNPSWSLELHVSRDVVFHSATLTGVGLYLIAMSGAGYYIQFIGGNWGIVLQTVFLFAAAVLLILLLFSAQLRARLRILLNTHFFSFKYDYREEWLRFTKNLAAGGEDVTAAVISALGMIIGSQEGWLWVRREAGGFECAGYVNTTAPLVTFEPEHHSLPVFLARTGWVIDLDEYHHRPDVYNELECPNWLLQLPQARLVIPLLLRNTLFGFVVLSQPRYQQTLNWEDRSLLKTAGLQAAVHVARHIADQALVRARQFEAFNQLSAYVAHDLKNLLAQQSLIVSNAEKHKHNPAFIEDVIQTVRSSVERMQRLMAQLRDGVRGDQLEVFALDVVLNEVIASRIKIKPAPQLLDSELNLQVRADRDRLRTVFSHLLQNAQEATNMQGQVTVRLQRHGNNHALIEIADDGCGMTVEFIRERLFRPFDSTKGLTGMGIGVFESRELIRLLGGELTVQSQAKIGTVFRMVLPIQPIANSAVNSITLPIQHS
ncbi:PEP-CTERM system histidine kinase PrsK [Rhodoferax sp. 4810]|uniref:histidine kinase n=1 Tax=Thiospirillum jenense TaxID=1653858 RepID=A0A839HET9_9GAMM|nr:XrtA/PEP-CTERM system histidine kinase PrsK [Thiospirillum jenense]MBB1077938.1 PEP-CTERM system histidine kinase PrsK [Rhodoferax jenense]MBB1127373.1 PEP-CTERM system histidine kinase PrsK [Thiospirillum jenense]